MTVSPRPTLPVICASAWLIRVFSHNLLQSSLCSINAGQTTPTTPQDVGDADGKERTRDRPHEVQPVAGKVPQYQVWAEGTCRIHRRPTDWTRPEPGEDDVRANTER